METKFPFTQRRLETLDIPNKGRYQFYDAKMPGLCIRVTTNGTKTAYLYKRVDGRPTRIKLVPQPAIDDPLNGVLTQLVLAATHLHTKKASKSLKWRSLSRFLVRVNFNWRRWTQESRVKLGKIWFWCTLNCDLRH